MLSPTSGWGRNGIPTPSSARAERDEITSGWPMAVIGLTDSSPYGFTIQSAKYA